MPWTVGEFFGNNVSYNKEDYSIDFCGDRLSIFASEEEVLDLSSKIFRDAEQSDEYFNPVTMTDQSYELVFREVEEFITEKIKDFRESLLYGSDLNFRTFSEKWDRPKDNNFAVACYNDNTEEELTGWIKDGQQPDKTDMYTWKITYKEYFDAIMTAINEKRYEEEA